MKILVLENHTSIVEEIIHYLVDNASLEPDELATVLLQANQQSTEDLLELLSTHDTILFKPTLIGYGQYNHIVMLIYKLISENKNTIKEIQLFYNSNHEKFVEELKRLWEGKRKFFDVVLANVKVYAVTNNKEKIEIIL